MQVDMMAVCPGWLDGSAVVRCKVEAGFQALTGPGNDVTYPICGDPTICCFSSFPDPRIPGPPDADNDKSCEIKAPREIMQIEAVIYDDLDAGRSGSSFDDDQPIYAPHVLECQFCPTNPDNVVASFDDLSKCEIDKPRKRGVLTHTAGPIADGE